MTNHWIDLKNTDCALIIGANPAENHPLSMKWLMEARNNGAKLIVVDPRFTRTASRSDIYARLRCGTDIAFIGGLINYVLENELYHKDYVFKYTNAAFLVNDGFEFKDGLFTGYDAATRKYDTSTWTYQRDVNGMPLRDETLSDSKTVFQLMKKHYLRYTAAKVAAVTGMSEAVFNEIASAYGKAGLRDNKSGTILYAMGGTQHTVGSQNVKAYAMLQLLLGNMGRPGGGVNALRGESNVQGSTDMGLLNNSLPGYLSSPVASPAYETLEAYNKTETPASGYWTNKPKFFISLLKAWWGANATSANEYAYQYLPKRVSGKNYSFINLFESMYDNTIDGLFCFGQNPVVGGPNAGKESAALANLDWLVCVDLFSTETANFWQRPGVDAEKVDTEVFLLPAAASFEKEGSISNSGRWIQYRWKAAEPPGQARSDLWIIYNLMQRIQAMASKNDPIDKPLRELTWNYGSGDEPDIDLVAREINGYEVASGAQLPLFSALTDTGSTASGCWIMCGMYPAAGNNLTKSRDDTDPDGYGHYRNWSYSWPANRRILYNRASANLDGVPWSEDKKIIWWDGSKWDGYDVPDFAVTKAPTAVGGSDPFIMKTEGVGGLFSILNEGPFPEHYEPYESPTTNTFSSIDFNPVATILNTAMNAKGSVSMYPVIGTTFRYSEHWQTGSMTRNCTWLQELIPTQTVEISRTLANAKRISNGDRVLIKTARGRMYANAMITDRIKPLVINGKTFEVIAVPWHFGFMGLTTGDSANNLTCHVGDANTMIPEYKAFLCTVARG